MSESPIARLLEALDNLDVEGCVAELAPGIRFLAVDGRRAEGLEAVRELLADFLGELRSTKHEVTAEWHLDGVWIAEVAADYELQDWLKITGRPRAFIARTGPEGIEDFRAYGAHERPLTEHRTGEEGMWVGTRWIPPL